MEDRGGLVLKVALRVPESRQSCSGKGERTLTVDLARGAGQS